MASKYFNVTGELTQELLAAGDTVLFTKISLSNVQGLHYCKADMFIEKKLIGKFYLFKDIKLPIGGAFVYEGIRFNNKASEFGLYIKLTKSDVFTLTGTINVTGTNTDVPGTNTLFLSELSVGDEITVTGETRTIATITNDTTATVTVAWGSDLDNDLTPDCSPKSRVDVILS